MKSKTDFTALGIIILVLGLAVCSRFLPHLPNVGVVSALGGSRISSGYRAGDSSGLRSAVSRWACW
jgi:hypothetical protein